VYEILYLLAVFIKTSINQAFAAKTSAILFFVSQFKKYLIFKQNMGLKAHLIEIIYI
jgi:hypothetical protein